MSPATMNRQANFFSEGKQRVGRPRITIKSLFEKEGLSKAELLTAMNDRD